MSSERRDSNYHHQAPPPVYTVYPGNHTDFNYAFHHHSNPQAPPPNYEDVITGRPGESIATAQPAGTNEGSGQAGVIFVAPVYKYTRAQRCFGTVFGVLFVVAFVSVFIKILSVQSHF